MKRRTLFVLALALLLVAAFLFHREPRERKPERRTPPEPALAAEPVMPPPTPVAMAPDPPAARPPRITPVRPPPAVVPAPPQPAAHGSIRGTVKILGQPPTRKKVRLDVDPKCVPLHPAGLLRDEIVVDEHNNVRWAFVYVARGVNSTPPGPLIPVLLDQVGCRFDPHVLGVRVNQPINIYNNDKLLHNVHAIPITNKEFNFGLPQAGLYETRTFSRPEIMIKIKCDIHPWMIAWVGVLDHPYFSVTSETGSYGIVNLPPGRYLVKVWHEMYADVDREIDVESGADLRVDFWLDAKKQ